MCDNTTNIFYINADTVKWALMAALFINQTVIIDIA